MGIPLHRDDFTGVLTEQLSKNGVLGVDVSVFTFMAWKKSEQKLFQDCNEGLCVKRMLELYNQGWILSPLWKYHVLVADSSHIDRDRLFQNAREQHGKELESFLASVSPESPGISPDFLHRYVYTEGRFSGFVYSENGNPICYSNGYLPNTWKQWNEKRSCLRSGIFINLLPPGDSPFFACKQQCEELLFKLIAYEDFSLT